MLHNTIDRNRRGIEREREREREDMIVDIAARVVNLNFVHLVASTLQTCTISNTTTTTTTTTTHNNPQQQQQQQQQQPTTTHNNHIDTNQNRWG
jgi:hypothetical protein